MKTDKADQRRAALLGGLRSLLESRRYADIGVTAITAEAGVTRPAFYFYFANKAEAMAALLGELEDEFLSVASSWYASDGVQAVEQLADGMKKTVGLWRQHEALIIAMIDAAAHDEAAGRHWGAFRAHFIDRVARQILSQTGDRLPGLGLDVEATATVLVGCVFGVLENDTRTGAHEDPAVLADTIAYVWSSVVYGDAAWGDRIAASVSGRLD